KRKECGNSCWEMEQLCKIRITDVIENCGQDKLNNIINNDLQSSVLHTFRLYPFLEAQPFTLWPHIWPSGFTGLREPIDIMSGKGMYRRPNRGDLLPPASVFCGTREAAAEEGAEAEAEAAPRGRGRGGRDHRSDSLFSCGGGGIRDGCCRLGIARPARGFSRELSALGAGELRQRRGGGGEERTEAKRVKVAKLHQSAEKRRRVGRVKGEGACSLGALSPYCSAFQQKPPRPGLQRPDGCQGHTAGAGTAVA
ncbi:hypothetical protein E2I00_004048, partial [Balaenoptera physalus]